MLDVEGADERLAGAGPRRPLLRDDDLVLLGTGPGSAPRPSATRSPRATCGRSASTTCAPIRRAAARAALERATAAGRRFLVHFDVDVIDFSDVPLSENTGRGIGVGFEAALAALGRPAAHDALLGLTVTELNPHHGAQDGADVARLAQALTRRAAPGVP